MPQITGSRKPHSEVQTAQLLDVLVNLPCWGFVLIMYGIPVRYEIKPNGYSKCKQIQRQPEKFY